jgi:hypothetical protein
MKTIRDFMNLIEADEIDPSKVTVDPEPAPAPAPAGEVKKTADGKKIIEFSPATVTRLRAIFKRADEVLKKYTDPKTEKPFESVDVESMTESEQRQYIMQNLHLLSEADQMVVLRDIMSEGLAKDALKYGIEKIGIPAGKWALKTGEKAVGQLYNTGKDVVGAVWRDVAAPLARWGGLGYGLYSVPWRDMFHLTPAVIKNLQIEDAREMATLQREYENLLPKLPEDSVYGWPEDLAKEADALNKRWDRFNEVATSTLTTPAKTDPGIVDKAWDTVKGLVK